MYLHSACVLENPKDTLSLRTSDRCHWCGNPFSSKNSLKGKLLPLSLGLPQKKRKSRRHFWRRHSIPWGDNLLDLGLGAGFLQLGNQLLGVFLGDGFLQGLGAVVNQILGVLQAQAGSGTDNLDNAQLGSAGALQDNVELGLLLDLSSSAGSGSGNSSSSGGNAA